MKPRVLIVLSNANDAGSWYRGIGPWAAIHKAGLAEVWYSPNPKWQEVKSVDAVFMLRPCTKELKPAGQAAKDFGVPLIVDYDDDLLNVPSDNPSHPFFALPEVRENYKEFLQGADAVITSTPFLRERLLELTPNKKVYVVPNAFDPCLLRFRRDLPRQNSVCWRGTSTHDRDVASVADEIVRSAAWFKDHLWIFMGADPAPWACSDRIAKKLLVPKLDLMPYFKAIFALSSKVMIVPLADQGFNRCKSNIAAIEGAFAGAAVLAPDWEEWRLPGVTTYTDAASFGAELRALLSNEPLASSRAKELWAHVRKNMTLQKANEARIAIVNQLVEGGV
jgi:glycosyltransferase involved in cell wall biosynthesis